jgi:TonB family protein
MMLKQRKTQRWLDEPDVAMEGRQILKPFRRGLPVPHFHYEQARWRWDRLATSLVLHAFGLFLLLKIVGWMPAATVQNITVTESVPLVGPVLKPPVAVKITPPRVHAQLHVPVRPLVPVPVPQQPKVRPLRAEVKVQPEVPARERAEREVLTPAPTKEAFVVMAPDSGSSAPPTLKAPARLVQTGGFGDPNGVRSTSEKKAPVTLATLGSFAMPAGPGRGNGTGGSKGDMGTVKSAGFGDGTAGAGSGDHGPRRTVAEGGFGGPNPGNGSRVRAAEAKPPVTPVEILFKPRPVYTDEGRKLHVEGEVVLEVVFASSGELRVQRVVKGLGHGLDEAAQHSATQIRFKPALRDGQPYDSTVLVHISFQLAE